MQIGCRPTDFQRQRVQELEQAVRVRDDFLAVAAHELRSPLNALALRLAVLEKLAAQGQYARFVGEIRRTQTTADRYVRRAVTLLDVSRLNAGVAAPAPEALSMTRVVAQVIDAYRDEAAVHRVELSDHVEQDATGYWDLHMLDQILLNLVGNAIRHGAGSPVTLRAYVDGTDAVYEVADRGPGIEARHQQRVFERFEQLRPAQPGSGGYGLGLWIVGRLVAIQKGSITIESEPGKGALFRVRLPLGSPTDME